LSIVHRHHRKASVFVLVFHPTTNTNMSRQQQEQHQQQGNASSTLIDLDDAFFGANNEEYGQHGDVTYKDQVREDLLSASLATATAARGGGGRAATTTDIPMVGAVAVSESQIFAEAEENRLHDVERLRDQVAQLEQKLAAVRAPLLAPHRRSVNRHDVADVQYFDDGDGYDDDRLQDAERRAATAEAARRDQEVRLAQLEREMAVVRSSPPALPLSAKIRHIGNRHDDVDAIENFDDDNDDDDIENWTQEHRPQQIFGTVNANTKGEDTANEGNDNSGENSSPTQPSQRRRRRRRCIVVAVVVVAVLIAAAVAARVCWTGRCSTNARARAILPYINSITLSGRTLNISRRSAEWRAVQWLIKDDLGTAVDDKQSLRQRYVLAILWYLQSEPGFGGANYEASWTTKDAECEWHEVECDDNGRVTGLLLNDNGMRGQIPHDLGLLTDLTDLNLDDNLLFGTIPSSLGALTALTSLYLNDNQLVGTMPLCDSDQYFEYLAADCDEVDCDCCTKCY
jgi:hypothetical protein